MQRSGEARLCKRPIWALVLLFVLLALGVSGSVAWQQHRYEYLNWESSTLEHEAILEARRDALSAGREPRWEDPGPLPEEPVRGMGGALASAILPFSLLLTFVVLTWAGVSSIRRIRASEGRLRGMGLAVTCAWTAPLAIVNALFLVPLTLLQDMDLFYVIVGPWILICLVGDVLFLVWQTRRQVAAA